MIKTKTIEIAGELYDLVRFTQGNHHELQAAGALVLVPHKEPPEEIQANGRVYVLKEEE